MTIEQIISVAPVAIFIVGGAITYGMVRGQVKSLTAEFVKLERRFDILSEAGLAIRVTRVEQDVRDLARGVGWKQGHGGVDGEYVGPG